MDKNIYKLQNQENILKTLVVQGKLYSKAKQINYLSFVICALFPILYSFAKNSLSGEILITVGSLFTIAVIFISPALCDYASRKRKSAAKVQQTIDFCLFEDNDFKTRDDNWGEIYTTDELFELIAKTKITEADIEKKKNWYNDYSSYPHVMQAHYSQRECVRWDWELRKCFVGAIYGCGALLIVVALIFAVVLKMSVFELLISIATFAPLIKRLLPLKKQLKSDRARLESILHAQKTMDNQLGVVIGGEELYAKIIKIQKQLFEHRANSLMIPDFFYKMRRNKQQRIEDKFAEQITKRGGL